MAVVGRRGEASTEEMLNFLRKGFFPQAVVAFVEEQDVARTQIALLKGRKMINGKSTAYVCEKGTCKAPVTSLKDLKSILDADYKKTMVSDN